LRRRGGGGNKIGNIVMKEKKNECPKGGVRTVLQVKDEEGGRGFLVGGSAEIEKKRGNDYWRTNSSRLAHN